MFDSDFDIEKQLNNTAVIDIVTNSIFFNKAKVTLSICEVHVNCVLCTICTDEFKMYIIIYKLEKLQIECIISSNEFFKYNGPIKNFMYNKKI